MVNLRAAGFFRSQPPYSYPNHRGSSSIARPCFVGRRAMQNILLSAPPPDVRKGLIFARLGAKCSYVKVASQILRSVRSEMFIEQGFPKIFLAPLGAECVVRMANTFSQ